MTRPAGQAKRNVAGSFGSACGHRSPTGQLELAYNWHMQKWPYPKGQCLFMNAGLEAALAPTISPRIDRS